MLLWRVFFIAFVLAATHPLLGHEDPHHRIEALTRRIAENPDDPALYLKRGELHRLVSHWDLALSDFERARELSPDYETIDLYRGRVQLDAGRFAEARETLDAFLDGYADHAEALTTRARAWRKLNQPLKAVDDYDRALTLAGDLAPGIHVERASALAESGETYLAAAVFGLDDAIRKLGPLIVLESKAIDLELTMRNYDAAIARIERVLIRMPRKETWLVRRGEVLERAGRAGEARRSFEEALASLESLPAYLRQVPASRDLEHKLRVVLNGEDR